MRRSTQDGVVVVEPVRQDRPCQVRRSTQDGVAVVEPVRQDRTSNFIRRFVVWNGEVMITNTNDNCDLSDVLLIIRLISL